MRRILFGLLMLWSATAVVAGVQSWEGSPIRVGNGQYVWDKELTFFEHLPGNFQVVAANKNGRVAGSCGDKALVFDPEFGTVDIGGTGPASAAKVFGMNDVGCVVGILYSTQFKTPITNAFMWNDFQLKNLHRLQLRDRFLTGSEVLAGNPSASSEPIAINNHGQVIAAVTLGWRKVHVLWDGDTVDYLFPEHGPNGIGSEQELRVLDILDDGRCVVLKKITPNRHHVYLYDREADTSVLMHAFTDPLYPV